MCIFVYNLMCFSVKFIIFLLAKVVLYLLLLTEIEPKSVLCSSSKEADEYYFILRKELFNCTTLTYSI